MCIPYQICKKNGKEIITGDLETEKTSFVKGKHLTG